MGQGPGRAGYGDRWRPGIGAEESERQLSVDLYEDIRAE